MSTMDSTTTTDDHLVYTHLATTPLSPPLYQDGYHCYEQAPRRLSAASSVSSTAHLPRLAVHSTSHHQQSSAAHTPTPGPVAELVQPKTILYSSVALALLHAMQFGWMIPQLNLSTFQDQDACDARPVVPNTCVMFPGHSASDWAWVINLWIVGGMASSLGCARVADRFGRKRALIANAVIMVIGGVIQASAQSVGVYAIGRLFSGLASGASTAIPNGYINEISPPHLRNQLGVLYQVALCVAIVMVGTTFFFADTSTGWRYIGGFPIVLGGIFLAGAHHWMVESPTWLLTHGRTQEAERVLARLFGQEHVQQALCWLAESAGVHEHEQEEQEQEQQQEEHSRHVVEVISCGKEPSYHDQQQQQLKKHPFRSLWLPAYRQQTILAIMLALGQRLSGINTAFLYSSSLFNDAGLTDDRIGSMIINVVDLIPVCFSGLLATYFGNRKMIIFGLLGMMLSALGITVSLLVNSGPLSIVFTATYVAAFASSLGPLVFVVSPSLFPHVLRASGTSLCLFANWCGTLLVGVSYPHIANALGDWSFMPFALWLAVATLYMVPNLPDTTGKTGDEIQSLFVARRMATQAKTKAKADVGERAEEPQLYLHPERA